MDGVKTYEDGIACAFDALKYAACNTDDARRSEILEEAAEDIIELAPTYKREWKDLTAALAREAALVETIRELSDRVVAGDGREAALREELAIIKDECIDHMNLHKAWTKQRDGLQQSLTAAEQRNAALTELLTGLPEGLKELSGCENTAGVQACIEYVEYCIGQIKPTESGASE